MTPAQKFVYPTPRGNRRLYWWAKTTFEIVKAIVWPFHYDYEPLPGFEPVRVPTHDEKMRAAARAEVRR